MENPEFSSLKPAIRTGQLTRDNVHWLSEITNPFPDYQQPSVGIPDSQTAKTAVKHVQKSLAVKAPTSGTGNWSFSVNVNPIDMISTAVEFPSPAQSFIGDTYGAAAAQTNFGGGATESSHYTATDGGNGPGIIAVTSKRDNTPGSSLPWDPTTPWGSLVTAGTASMQGMTLLDTWASDGAARIVSFGFEVTDVTADLYKQGLITSYRRDINSSEAHTLLHTGGGSPFDPIPSAPGVIGYNLMVPSVKHFTGFPSNTAEAFRIPGSQQWDAKLGAYVVATFDENYTDFETLRYLDSAILHSEITTAPLPFDYQAIPKGRGIIVNMPAFDGNPIPPATSYYTTVVPGAFAYTHMDISGIIAEGLAESASFVITLKAVIEIVPNSNSSLIDFVRPSNDHSPKIMEMYNRMVHQIPPAVHRGDNDTGDFFKTLIKIAAPVASVLFPTFAPAIMMGSKAVTAGIDIGKENKRKKKEKKQREAIEAEQSANRTVNEQRRAAQRQREVQSARKRK